MRAQRLCDCGQGAVKVSVPEEDGSTETWNSSTGKRRRGGNESRDKEFGRSRVERGIAGGEAQRSQDVEVDIGIWSRLVGPRRITSTVVFEEREPEEDRDPLVLSLASINTLIALPKTKSARTLVAPGMRLENDIKSGSGPRIGLFIAVDE